MHQALRPALSLQQQHSGIHITKMDFSLDDTGLPQRSQPTPADQTILDEQEPLEKSDHQRRKSDSDIGSILSGSPHRVTKPQKYTHLSKKKHRDFQRKHFHLQDATWGSIKKKGTTAKELQSITKSLDQLDLKQHRLSDKVLNAPRSSSRFDWFYNSAERLAKRKALKARAHRASEREVEQMSLDGEGPYESNEKGKDEGVMDMEDERFFEVVDDESSLRRHSR